MKNEDYQKMFELAMTGDAKLLAGFSLFHNYSFFNQIWAMWQMQARGIQISPIATFKKWNELGRKVNKGAKAIELCMPVSIKDKDENGEERKKTIFIFRKNWFAMSQTTGEEVDFPETHFDFDGALKTLNIEKIPFSEVNGNIQGYAKKRQIAINPLDKEPHATFFHEVGHVELGHTEHSSDARSIQEVEAETVALFCLLSLGLEGVEHSRGYIKNWMRGQEFPIASIKKAFSITTKILKAGTGEEVSSLALDKVA